MKSSPFELTEVVYIIGADGTTTGPYVKKTFESDSPLGAAYGYLMAAQKSGARFSNLPRIVEYYERGGRRVAVMEHLEGATLREFGGTAWLPLFLEVCDAAIEMHERFEPPLIHRDIKPDNVMVCDGHVVLVDLGASRLMRTEHQDDEGVASSSGDTHPFATRAYAPPEQFGYGQTDARSDVYSLGMLLSFLVFGRDPDALLRNAVSEGEDALVRMGASPLQASVIARACAFDPKARFQSVRELKAALLEPSSSSVGLSTSKDVEGERFSGGIVWDCIVGGIWVLFVAACISLAINPPEETASHPMWLRFVEYAGVTLSFLTMGFLAVLDYRPIRLYVRGLSRIRRWQPVAIDACVFLVMLVLYGISSTLLGLQ